MKLFYLIREYQKELNGASPRDEQVMDHILSLDFFDKIKHKHKENEMNEKILRRKLMIKHEIQG